MSWCSPGRYSKSTLVWLRIELIPWSVKKGSQLPISITSQAVICHFYHTHIVSNEYLIPHVGTERWISDTAECSFRSLWLGVILLVVFGVAPLKLLESVGLHLFHQFEIWPTGRVTSGSCWLLAAQMVLWALVSLRKVVLFHLSWF